MEKMNNISIYTDGGSRKNGEGAFAFTVIENDKEVYSKASYQPSNMTNNKMELSGVIEAIIFFKSKYDPVKYKCTIFTDSQYVQKGITEWIHKWEKHRWVNSSGEPVKNKKYWELLDKLSNLPNIEFKWVKGHSGNKYNERADWLCNEAFRLKN